jgi:antitoxin component YwqK of YwqJK toxin-antitoxin module
MMVIKKVFTILFVVLLGCNLDEEPKEFKLEKKRIHYSLSDSGYVQKSFLSPNGRLEKVIISKNDVGSRKLNDSLNLSLNFFKKGSRDGTVIEYFKSGIKKREIYYENDEMVMFRDYFQNGALFIELDQKKGVTKGWYEGGQIHGITDRNGGDVCFYKNGLKRFEGKLYDDLRIGKWQFWDSTGVLQKEIRYENGTPMDSVIFPN